MLHLENHALSRSQSCQRPRDPRSQLAPHQVPLRTRSRPVVRDLVDDAVLFTGGVGYDGRIFLAHLALAEMIEAEVGDDPVDPGVERTLEAEAAEVSIRLEERVLVDVARVLLGTGQMQGQSENRVVILTDEFFEGTSVTALRSADQLGIVDAAWALPHHSSPAGSDFETALSHHANGSCVLRYRDCHQPSRNLCSPWT